MSLLICLMTVHPAKVGHYYENLAFLGHSLRILSFEPIGSYKGKSDYNPEIPKEILRNTKTCISMGQNLGKDYVLVLQEDVVFTDNQRMAASITKAVKFMDDNPDADMFMFGEHPSSVHSGTAFPDIVKFSYATHWQAVMFRVNAKDKFGELPSNVHADMYFSGQMKDKINCYGLRVPVAKQKSDRIIRKYEYDIFYEFRCKYPNGDPLPMMLGVFLLIIFCLMALSYFDFYRS